MPRKGANGKTGNKGHILAFNGRVGFLVCVIKIGTYFAKKSDATSLAREDMRFYRLSDAR
ncbi:MAG: hypothetical protein AMS15_08545 [Planctomycetes bacterium DG_23]|nr:MAG: hypothetical protein AMS15_08545 [Planctomycetes bacterium DG_23]